MDWFVGAWENRWGVGKSVGVRVGVMNRWVDVQVGGWMDGSVGGWVSGGKVGGRTGGGLDRSVSVCVGVD